MTLSLLAIVFFYSDLHHNSRCWPGINGRGSLSDLQYYDTSSDAASHETSLPGSTADVSSCNPASYRTASNSSNCRTTAASIQSQSIFGGGCCSLGG